MNDHDNDPLIPASSRELIERLDREYPARCIQPSETLEQAREYAAIRRFIDELVALQQEDQESARAFNRT